MSPKEPSRPNKSKKNPNPKLEMLRRQMKDAKKRTNNPSLKRRSQTEFFPLEQVQQLQKIIDAKNPKNIEIAVDLMRIFRRASSGEYQMVADERGRNVDHEKLFLITRKVIEFERVGKEVILTKEEKSIMRRYTKEELL